MAAATSGASLTTAATAGNGPPPLFQSYLLPTLSFRKHRQRLFPRRESSGNAAADVSSCPRPYSLSPSQPALESTVIRVNMVSTAYMDHEYDPELLQTIPSSSSGTDDSGSCHELDVSDGFLTGHTSHIACSRCHADLALTSQIISKGFTGRHGRAYLVAATTSPLTSGPTLSSSSIGLPNTNTHKPVPRHLVTGLHTVCDISCAQCDSILGWKYVSAEDEAQRYKVGKFILETRRIIVGSCWENYDQEDNESGDEDAVIELSGRSRLAKSGRVGSAATKSSNAQDKEKDPVVDEEILFDSQDEDECEDLFSGVWSPQLARRRRWRKKNLRT